MPRKRERLGALGSLDVVLALRTLGMYRSQLWCAYLTPSSLADTMV